jgi:hypothetical protein
MQTIPASEIFVFDAYQLVVVRTCMRSARTRSRTLRIEQELMLVGSGRKLRAFPVGTGSHRGHVTILLRLHGDFARAIECLAAMRDGGAIELRHADEPAEGRAFPASTTLRSVVVDNVL